MVAFSGKFRGLVAGAAALATLSALLFAMLPIRCERVLAPGAMEPHIGLAYAIALELSDGALWEFRGDSNDDPRASNLRLHEGGRLLGPPHSTVGDIRTRGAGVFSHWERWLIFSSSDGSDPRTNGHRYTISVSPQITTFGWALLAALDLAALLLFRRRLSGLVSAYPRRLGYALSLATLAFAALVAAGKFGLVTRPEFGATDAYLACDVLFHVVLACVITLAQWMLGAGLARLLLPKHRTRFADVVLAGFPLSLVLMALLSGMALTIPYGGTVALLLASLCVIPLVLWPLERAAVRDALASLPALLAVSIGFGCWMALIWHGPTATLPGFPLGDEVFYGSSIWSLASHPIGRPNLGNEGESFAYFNVLLPAVGAALLSVFPIDGILFIASAAAIAVLGTGLALQSYLSDRPDLGRHSLESLVLFLALVGAGWFPSWLVSSPQVAFAVPLTVSVWFWARQARASGQVAVTNACAALLGSALTKVVTAGTLLPLALSSIVSRKLQLSTKARLSLALVAIVGVGYALSLLHRNAPLFWTLGGWGPDSYAMFVHGNERLSSVWPYLARDVGAVMIGFVAFRLTTWPTALAIAIGIALFLAYPFALRANFICAVVAFGLAAIDAPQQLARNRYVVLVACILIAPAMLLGDPSGLATGVAWVAVIAAVVYRSVSPGRDDSSGTPARFRWQLPTTAAIATCVILLGAAFGTLPVPRGDGELSPEVRNIWRAVREQTPPDALVFTDQTGREPRLLEGWNTYALHGQRQVYIANWLQSPELRIDAARRSQRLEVNDEILSGRREPTSVITRQSYRQFAAVVSSTRELAPSWRCVYSNRAYALYLWDPISTRNARIACAK